MYLYFQHANGKYSLVSDVATDKNVYKLISADVYKRNPKFKIYYYRKWNIPGGVCFDVGSHTEYYLLMVDPVNDTSEK